MNYVLFTLLFGFVGLMVVSSSKKSISKHGLNLIKSFEGFSDTVYLDVGGHPTIGYGHLIKEGETLNYLTKPEAEELLKDDVKVYEKAINDLVRVKLSQSMFDALVSFTYNVGVGAFSNSTLLRVLNNGDYLEAHDQFARWNKATVNGEKKVIAGLEKRREREQELFFS